MTSEDEGPVVDREARLAIYVEALRARMEPDRFELFQRLLGGVAEAMAAAPGAEQVTVPDIEDGGSMGADVYGEVMIALGILGGHVADALLVDLGDGVLASMTEEAAGDPAAREEARAWIRERQQERTEDDQQLRGIAQASGMDESA